MCVCACVLHQVLLPARNGYALCKANRIKKLICPGSKNWNSVKKCKVCKEGRGEGEVGIYSGIYRGFHIKARCIIKRSAQPSAMLSSHAKKLGLRFQLDWTACRCGNMEGHDASYSFPCSSSCSSYSSLARSTHSAKASIRQRSTRSSCQRHNNNLTKKKNSERRKGWRGESGKSG